MRSYQQELPFCLKIELTEGCPLRCSFCGINSIRGEKHDYRFASLDTVLLIAQQVKELGWSPRIEMGMRGEPTLNPQMLDIVHALRYHIPDCYMLMTSNGAGLLKDPVGQIAMLFSAGLSALIIDEYEQVGWARQIEAAVVTPLASSVDICYYPAEGEEANPHHRSKRQRLIFVPPINLVTTGTRLIHNQAAHGMPPTDAAQGKRCARPFREMAFLYDGAMVICCNDWRGNYTIGSIVDSSLLDLWNSTAFHAARKHIYHGMRTFRPCRGCECTGYRLGLLPDKKGKETLAKPTKRDRDAVAAVVAAGPHTTPVTLPWEKELDADVRSTSKKRS